MMKPTSPYTAAKKRLPFMAVMLTLILCFLVRVYATEQVTVLTNVTEDGIVYLPLRTTFEELGYHVSWIADEQKVLVQDDDSAAEYRLSDTEHVMLRDNVTFVVLDHCAAQGQLGYTAQANDQTVVYRIGEPDMERMMRSFEQIASKPHPPQSEELTAVRDFLVRSLEAMGYETQLQAVQGAAAYLPPSSHLYEENPDTAGYNLIATKPSQNSDTASDILVLGTGYDSKPGSPDAIASGNGVVGLLEIAELVKDIPSPVELRFVFFDCTSSGLGAFHYARSLSADEIQRTIAMIELNLVGSQSESETIAHTLDGMPNYLTDLFDRFDVAPIPQGSFIPFYSLNIPTVRISEDPVTIMNYIAFANDKKDTLDIVDTAKLNQTVDCVAEVVGVLLSDATTTLQKTEIDAQQIGRALPLKQRFAFDKLNQEDIAAMVEVPLVRVPITPVWGKQAYSSYAAYIDWLDIPLLTNFQFISQNSELSDIRAVVPDAAELIALLDAQYTRFDKAEEYVFPQVTNRLEDALCWHDDNGNAYILEQGTSDATLWLSAYHKDSAPLNISALADEKETLSEAELQAWQKVEELLLAADLRDEIQDIVFTDDGKGDTILNLAPAPLAPDAAAQKYTVKIDAHDLASSDEEQLDKAALQSFLSSWAIALPESYLEAYVDTFGKKWVTAYTEQESSKTSPLSEEKAKELEAQNLADPMRMASFMHQDLANAFIYYTCGITPDAGSSALKQSFAKLYGDDYDEVISAFFDDISDFTALKAYIADIS